MVWSDMTAAYEMASDKLIQRCYRPCCGFVSLSFWHSRDEVPPAIVVHNCVHGLDTFELSAFQLCEKDLETAKDGGKEQQALPLAPLNRTITRMYGKRMVRCPAGHVMHCFLSIHFNSACWEYDDVMDKGQALWQQHPELLSCWRPLQAIPVHFVCRGSGHPLPYTLVCDHRQDCWDNTDEEFCVFPPCAGDTPRKCASNQQVSICRQPRAS